MKYSLKDFDYNLPQQLIAQQPIKPRDHSRLLFLDKRKGEIEHSYFYNIIDKLNAGDVLVLNNSKVFPARLLGWKKETKGSIEIFLHHHLKKNTWECLLKGKIKMGMVVEFNQGLEGRVIEDNNDGTWQVEFNYGKKKFWEVVNRIGLVPLPPYIKRDKKDPKDKIRYQTVFANAKKTGSVAAPTAGLHFTDKLLEKAKTKGVKILEVTLHVGLGTFAPVKTEKIGEHKMHSEWLEVNKSVVQELKKAKKGKRRIIAVGTTSCRTLESIDLKKEERQLFSTNIFIYPGYKFKVIDALITNFHLPKSTLLMLVSALASKKHIEKAYQEAIEHNYRFFSYGDAMFIY